MSVVAGVAGGFGPFDEEQTLGMTEYGGGSGLVEGSPLSQSGKDGRGLDHLTKGDGSGMHVDEKIGVVYRLDPTVDIDVDPVTGLIASDTE